MNLDDRPDYSYIGARIAVLRGYLDLNRPDFAKANGFTPSQLANWEYGLRRISPDAAIRLVERYGVTLDWIYLGRASALPQNLAKAFGDKPTDKAHSKSKD